MLNKIAFVGTRILTSLQNISSFWMVRCLRMVQRKDMEVDGRGMF